MRPAPVAVALAVAVLGRAVVASNAVADPILVGLVFGAVLLVVAIVGGAPVAGLRARPVALGIAGGATPVLVVLLALVGAHAPTVPSSMPIVPWAVATVVVATGEEAVLRGVLFDAIGQRRGAATAVLVTSLCFALMHVPLYGWYVLPLDFGVGLWLAGLRLLTGGIVAPAIAHALADLATYWL